MAKGPKIARRDLKEDKAYMTMAGVVDFFVRYRLLVALAALGVLVAFAVGYYTHIRSQSTTAEASWALYQTDFLQQPLEKVAALREVAAGYGKTQAGRFASFELANSLYDEGRYEEALGAFREFLKNNPGHILASSAMEAIGYCGESLGQWEEAIRSYEQLIKDYPASAAAARVNYRLGHCYEKVERKEKAIEAYGKTIELLPGSLWAIYSERRLASLSPSTHPPSETKPPLPGLRGPLPTGPASR